MCKEFLQLECGEIKEWNRQDEKGKLKSGNIIVTEKLKKVKDKVVYLEGANSVVITCFISRYWEGENAKSRYGEFFKSDCWPTN